MGIKKIEESKNKKLETKEVKKIDEKALKRINAKFRQYWKYLFGLIFVYIICYLIWFFFSKRVRIIARDKG